LATPGAVISCNPYAGFSTIQERGLMLERVRSALFVPADAVGRHERAFGAGADAVLLDLEDAVAPSAKDAARAALATTLGQEREGGAIALVRVNSPTTETGRTDLEAVAELRVDGIVVPKADPEAIAVAVAATLDLPILALVETASGVLAAAEIAAHPAVELLMIGAFDLGAEVGVGETPDGDELAVARGMLVLAAAAAGLPGPLDGPCALPRDHEVLDLEIARARRLGFSGKACIHPVQVAAVAAAFAPTAEEREWALKIEAAFEAGGGGVVAVDGEMVDRPVALRAQRILAAVRN
jgi:citrate lyase subunit beta / citryl-CoA lyase